MPNILIVDDSKEDRFFIRRAITKKLDDANIVEFSYAEEALAYLRAPDRPNLDLVLVDLSMPRMDGFEFANRYSDLYSELRGDAPLYIVSSSIDPLDKDRADLHPGISGLLAKPLSGDVVAGIVG